VAIGTTERGNTLKKKKVSTGSGFPKKAAPRGGKRLPKKTQVLKGREGGNEKEKSETKLHTLLTEAPTRAIQAPTPMGSFRPRSRGRKGKSPRRPRSSFRHLAAGNRKKKKTLFTRRKESPSKKGRETGSLDGQGEQKKPSGGGARKEVSCAVCGKKEPVEWVGPKMGGEQELGEEILSQCFGGEEKKGRRNQGSV